MSRVIADGLSEKARAAFATSAQGDTADSALQDAAAFATAAQGNTADSALQAEHRKTGQLALTQNANVILIWYHNVGAVPDHAWTSLVCVTAEHGYSVGDEIEQWVFYDSYNFGPPSVVKSANKVQLPLGDYTQYVIRPVASITADYVITTRSSWRIKFHAIWYN